MTDNLRDRIVAALQNMTGDLIYQAMADAVIAELNIARACEGGCVWQIPERCRDMTPQQQAYLARGQADD